MVMSTTATAGGTAETTRGRGPAERQQAMPTVPFIRASQEHRESIFDVSRQMTASDQDLGFYDVSAVGYVRAIVLHVTTTGGAAGAAPGFQEDGPFSVLKNIAFSEPNGAAPFQVVSGYSLYLIHKYGGYRGYNEPKAGPAYSKVDTTSPAFSFIVRIPVEVRQRDALGSLPNQNAASMFKVRLTLGKVLDVFVGALTTAPTVRIRGYIEAWDQPATSDLGAVNQVAPPAVNTTQFWVEQTFQPGAGLNTLRLTRVGNFIRNLILINRRAASTRANGEADFPTDLFELMVDTRTQDAFSKALWREQMYERYGYTGAFEAVGGPDNGVFAYDFTHEFDGRAGNENNDLWLPTIGSTRLELRGTWAQAGSLTVLTNDVAVAGTVFM